ncbi:hypothetical protein [Bradyrhizobium elkanii]|uniref:Uncharacterized protein n=1 Tax=Bradyrhizobium elkanii TaxID=29448 RepID=A0ABV4FAG2_BRAEL|nr:hypothetical protein [Bradyrhizobium elkanii]MCP1752027.1 hypothetical protein [Bradyrhizobium elkanii]MCP1977798.1 hypothetical protein [Bradyrhizobium elkanii]MCS3887684.1 hypothetical protein [Bradyrhizobium elkanii]MCS4213297.1 hypothetical protein [Bradyrhizobium elkanii]MCW2213603.1 hypothetical protein [Bradyrhizobium elkanii]
MAVANGPSKLNQPHGHLKIDGFINDEYLRLIRVVKAGTMQHVNARLSTIPLPTRAELESLLTEYLMAKVSVVEKVNMYLAYDLGIRDEGVLQKINNAATFGNIHTLILDNIIDNKGIGQKAELRNVYLAHIIFDFYVDDWLKISKTADQFQEFVQFELETYSALFDEELNHVGTSKTFSSKDLNTHKCSPFKAIAIQVLRAADRDDLKPKVFWLIDRASFALCTLDDILDWEQDFDRRRFTYPLQLAFDKLGISYKTGDHDKIKRKVFRTLCYGTLYHDIMKELTQTLEECMEVASGVSKGLAFWFHEYHGLTMDAWRDHVRFLVSAK